MLVEFGKLRTVTSRLGAIARYEALEKDSNNPLDCGVKISDSYSIPDCPTCEEGGLPE